jgi:hypothetical protein
MRSGKHSMEIWSLSELNRLAAVGCPAAKFGFPRTGTGFPWKVAFARIQGGRSFLMNPLRQRMFDDMQIRNFAPSTPS